jgi:alkylation response protein AidB-like acyl-CoA dehydrogenase
MAAEVSLDEFVEQARQWLAANAPGHENARDDASTAKSGGFRWGVGSDELELFSARGEAEEEAALEATKAWERLKFDAGYGNAIGADLRFGGRSLSRAYVRAFAAEERRFPVPSAELFNISVMMIAPTIAELGTAELAERLVPSLLRMDSTCCQLLSEPGAGSDLAAIATSAVRDGDGWIVNGQKVWTSGARQSDYGLLICRTDKSAGKHAGLSAFVIELDQPGVDVRPIRQMTGGSSFNEVFFTDAVALDANLIGELGDGWKVASTMLRHERATASGAGSRPTGTRAQGNVWPWLRALATEKGVLDDPEIRAGLARAFAGWRIASLNAKRTTDEIALTGKPGPTTSFGKLLWTRNLQRTSAVATEILGPELTADDGTWGTYSWSQYVLGTPGFRIAGGTDEIQRNIIAERVLGLPAERK